MFIPHNTKTINLTYKSKYNRKRENQVVLLMIINGEESNEADKWHYIVLRIVRTDDGFNRPIRSLSRLFRGITGDNALKRHERLCDNNDYCNVEMPTQVNKALKYNHGEKLLKAPLKTLKSPCWFRMFINKRAILSKQSK